jgi:hypothetical protein
METPIPNRQESIRTWTTRALLLSLFVGAGVAALVLAVTPSAYTPPPPIRYDLQKSPFTNTLQIISPTAPATTTPITWDAFLNTLATATSGRGWD